MLATESATDRRKGRQRGILLVADAGIAASRLEATLVGQGYEVARAALEAPDLFSAALGNRAIVFVPAANLLSAQLSNQGDPQRVDALIDPVLRAARAPGVELLVAALPEADPSDRIVEAIQRDGKPYAIMRTPGLMEEVAQTLEQGEGTLWLPRTGAVNISSASALAAAVAKALETEEQGRVETLPSQRFDVAGLFAAASNAAGGRVRVRAVSPFVYHALRPVARWLKGREPPPLAFADQLLARQTGDGDSHRPRGARRRHHLSRQQLGLQRGERAAHGQGAARRLPRQSVLDDEDRRPLEAGRRRAAR